MDIMTAQTLYHTMYDGKCKTVHGTPTVDANLLKESTNEKTHILYKKLPLCSYVHGFLYGLD